MLERELRVRLLPGVRGEELGYPPVEKRGPYGYLISELVKITTRRFI